MGGSIEVFATKAVGNTIFNYSTNGAPVVGDNITISSAKWSPFNGIPELGLTSGTTTYARNSQNPGYIAPVAHPRHAGSNCCSHVFGLYS